MNSSEQICMFEKLFVPLQQNMDDSLRLLDGAWRLWDGQSPMGRSQSEL